MGCWRTDYTSAPSSNRHLILGNPSQASSQQPDNYLMIKPQYALSYSRSQGIPNWAAWRLVASDLAPQGTSKRQNDFRIDPDLPEDWPATNANDYSGSGFDRGHLVSSEDRSSTTADNSATFVMTNIIPQAPDNNRGVWVELEKYCRRLARQGKTIYIVAGGEGRGGVGERGARRKLAKGQRVPAKLWKVVLVMEPGQTVNDISAKNRAFGVVIPNTQGVLENSWYHYRRSVREIEQLTGYNFFGALPATVQDALETRQEGVGPD